MFHILLIIAIAFGVIYYGETHGLINPGGIVPDLRNIHLPTINTDETRKHFHFNDL
jgi:hypothetical protein